VEETTHQVARDYPPEKLLIGSSDFPKYQARFRTALSAMDRSLDIMKLQLTADQLVSCALGRGSVSVGQVSWSDGYMAAWTRSLRPDALSASLQALLH
jgi:hypothetical protein